MNSLKFKPEGWNNEITPLDQEHINQYRQKKETLQGLVKRCDNDYNLYIQFQNGLTGVMPRQEIEAINTGEEGLPRTNLCTGKVHKFVQFKIKEAKDDNRVIVSRREVQEEALKWIKNELEPGTIVNRNCKKHQKIWRFCGHWGRNYWAFAYRRYFDF